jgi:hypothetical protein
VGREGRTIAPLCYDAEGSETNLKALTRRVELFLAGRTETEVDLILAGEYQAGKLMAPRRSGIAYMLSPHFERHPEEGKPAVVFAPHLMFYAPYLKNSDIGASPTASSALTQPFILDEGKPTAYIIVVPNGVVKGDTVGQPESR